MRYIDKGGVFTSFDPPGSASTTINGVNDLGDIVGLYTSPKRRRHRLYWDSRTGAFNLGIMLAEVAGLGSLGYRTACKATLTA